MTHFSYENITGPQLIRDLSHWDVAHVIDTQLDLANLFVPLEDLPSIADLSFDDVAALWKEILSERLHANVTMRLEKFLLFEWFPRSPGLYYTTDARMAREEALYALITTPSGAGLQNIDEADRLAMEDDAYRQPDVPDYMYIFTPHGKIQMIKGGVGCVRLNVHKMGSDDVWFMSASSTPVAHEGFPVAIPDHLYQKYIDQIKSNGVLPCTLVGKLKVVPERLVTLYSDYRDVPHLYLKVEKIEPGSAAVSRTDTPPRVSVAVSFSSAYEGQQAMYASYVTFYPGVPGSLRSRADWLENTYVRGMYSGTVVTDFDEQMTRFSGATFSLKKVLTYGLKRSELEAFNEIWGHQSGDAIDRLLASQNQVVISINRDYIAGDKISIGDVGSGAAVAAGRGAEASVTSGISGAQLDSLFSPLFSMLRQTDDEIQASALKQAEALKSEVARGDQADDTRMAQLIDGLVELVPGAVSTLVSMFASPILGGIAGPVTKFAIGRLKGI